MKKSIITTFVVIVCWVPGFTQCLKGITTNPDAPVNTERPDKRNTFFDWRALIYNINSQFINAPQIESPFNQSNNVLVNHFLNNQDRLPQDGWELIKYDMGFNENGTPKTTPIGYIHLVLYNKFTGVMRVFVAGDYTQAFNGAKIEIKYLNGKMSSALSNSSKLFGLDKFEADPSITSVSGYNNNNGRWFYADFQIGYDPCTCIYESTMVIITKLITESKIDLSGSVTGTLTNIASGAGSVLENSYSFNVKDLLTVAKKAQKSYKEFSKFTSDQEKALNIEGKTNLQLTVKELLKRNSLNEFQEAIKMSSFLKAGLKAAPYVGAAIELIDFFVGGGKKTPGPQEVKIMPMALNAKINLKGTLSTSFSFGDITFYTPGSLNAQTKNPVDYPYYNEVLGVLNLLETPKVYQKNLVSTGYYDQGTGYYEDHYLDVFQIIPIKYVVNPAAGFNTTNIEIMASLDFGTFKTAYVPLSALSTFSVEAGSVSGWNGQNNYGYPLGCTDGTPLALRLLINLERLETDANTQNVLLALTYPIDYINGQSFTFAPSYCNNGLTTELTLTNQTVPYDVSAWDKITIGPNTTFTGSRIIKAPNIVVLPGAVIPSNVRLLSSLPNGHVPTQILPASQTEIQTFCSSTQYNSQLRNLRLRAEDTEPKEESIEIKILTAYPNPATNLVTFQYYLEVESIVNLSLFDIMGREIANPINEQQTVGLHELNFDISYFESGVYLYTLTTNQGNETKRLLIIR